MNYYFLFILLLLFVLLPIKQFVQLIHSFTAREKNIINISEYISNNLYISEGIVTQIYWKTDNRLYQEPGSNTERRLLVIPK